MSLHISKLAQSVGESTVPGIRGTGALEASSAKIIDCDAREPDIGVPHQIVATSGAHDMHTNYHSDLDQESGGFPDPRGSYPGNPLVFGHVRALAARIYRLAIAFICISRPVLHYSG